MVVYDFGGGTFDVSILEVKSNLLKHLAIDGDILLGGHDIDELLRDYASNEIKRLHQTNLLDNVRNAQKLLQMCEQCKRGLTTSESARWVLVAWEAYKIGEYVYNSGIPEYFCHSEPTSFGFRLPSFQLYPNLYNAIFPPPPLVYLTFIRHLQNVF